MEIIKVELDQTDPRVCDYCNETLMKWDEEEESLKVVEDCATTDYGLICNDCIGSIEAITNFQKGNLASAKSDGTLEKKPEEHKSNFSALSKALEPSEKLEFEDLFKDGFNPTELVMDKSHIKALIHRSDLDEDKLDYLESRTIKADKKGELDREITKFATILEERHGYTIDIDRAVKGLWNLQKIGFLGEREVTTYYFSESNPVLFGSSENYLILAPKAV